MKSADRQTLMHYEESVPYYTLAFDRSHSRHLDAFLDQLQKGAYVLELGCGTGRDAARMIERGFRVDPTDATAAMVRKARERHAVNARKMHFDELGAQSAYDAVWAHACLFHAPRNALPSILTKVHDALVLNGQFYASFKRGDAEFRDYRGRLNTHFETEQLHVLFCEAKFAVKSIEPWEGTGADGVVRRWLSVTASAQ